MLAPVAPAVDYDDVPDERGASYAPIEGPLWALVAVGLVVAVLSANPLLTAASFLTFPILVALLWRRGEVPILLFAAGFQWLQVSAKVFQANILGVHISVLGLTPTVERATWMGLLALIVLAIGMRLALRTLRFSRSEEAAGEARMIPLSKAFTFYLICAVIGLGANAVTWMFAGLTQIAIGIEGIKWIGFYVFAYVVLTQRQGYVLLAGVTAVEFVQGIGFFSGFKTVIFVLVLAFFTASRRIDARSLGFGLAGLAGLLVIGSAWTVVKGQYRGFLNQGSQMQETVVSREAQMAKMAELVSELSWGDIERGFSPLLSRVAYVDFFGATMDFVPSVVEHQRGVVWREALENLIPRLFYPEKPILTSDSEHTARYTGIYVASADEGTSISLGYVADSYIDFGPVWMYLPILLVGFLWGLMYRYFIRRSDSALLAFGFALSALLVAYQYEIAAVKLVAGVTVKFLVLAVVLRFFGEQLRAWLGISEADLAEAEWDEPEALEPDYA